MAIKENDKLVRDKRIGRSILSLNDQANETKISLVKSVKENQDLATCVAKKEF